ncbi:MAG TPA: hypothetical protein VI818_08815 [Candidatus Thermoplasmatota archaeon]|nr:hypothetical protein [Candidatus Thermoplasmatota archaeon]
MTPDRHADWYTVVRAHWRKTTGFLLASREPCLTIRDQELASVKGRSLSSRDPKDLAGWAPPKSWILGVIVCPGDRIDGVVAWVRGHRADPNRVWFYLHPTTPLETLRPWADAGFDTDQAATVSSWRELHKLYGLALNDRVYGDWNDHAKR